MDGEISYDLIMKEDMEFAEGVFRLSGGAWQILIARKSAVSSPSIYPQNWSSGINGLYIKIPENSVLNRLILESLLKNHLGVDEWQLVKGPDSMQLR